MVRITKDYFSIRQICESGQCFRLERLDQPDGEDEIYGLTALGRYLEISQKGNEITFGCTPREFDQVWKNYFDLEEDYGKIIGSIDPQDAYLLRAADHGSGIRILRQDLWEMIISFIISQQNHIKRIRRCIRLLCERYGEKRVAPNGVEYYVFPTPKALSQARIEDLYACNLGYRSRYIYETANAVLHREINMEKLAGACYADASRELLKLCGVGAKVADCICLFALHKMEAFPKDTHINKVLAARYPNGFPFDRYHDCGGVLQQYLFFYDLNGMS